MKKRNLILFILAAAAALLVSIFLPWIVSGIFAHSPESGGVWRAESVLEYYGAVLTLAGTLVLGVVTVWQTKKSLKIAEKENAREERAEQQNNKPDIYIRKMLYEEMSAEDMSSAWLLGLMQTPIDANYKKLYQDPAAKNTLARDLLLLEIMNESNGPVEIYVDPGKISQRFPAAQKRQVGEGRSFGDPFDFYRGQPETKTILKNESVKLVIYNAGRPSDGRKNKIWYNDWALVLPLHLKNTRTETERDQVLTVWYKIDNITEPGKQIYTIEQTSVEDAAGEKVEDVTQE